MPLRSLPRPGTAKTQDHKILPIGPALCPDSPGPGQPIHGRHAASRIRSGGAKARGGTHGSQAKAPATNYSRGAEEDEAGMAVPPGQGR